VIIFGTYFFACVVEIMAGFRVDADASAFCLVSLALRTPS
jgi:hypothetical protein